MSDKRMTEPTRKVLQALLDDPELEHYGLALSRQADIPHGTMYGILVRLEGWGWVEHRLEYPDDRAAPPRRYYRLTRDGATRAQAALAHAAEARSQRRPRSAPNTFAAEHAP
jgi:PadR family transcriptional regulator, regulatory protein PadR